MKQTISLACSVAALVIATFGSTPLGEAARNAATQALPRGSVGTLQLKRNAVTSSKIAPNTIRTGQIVNESLLAADFRQGQLPRGEKGEKGVKGDKGDPGTPALRLFAHVSSSGTLAENSGALSATRPSTGTYDVRFNRSLVGCVAVASVGFGFGPGVIGAGALAQARMNANAQPDTVRVTVYRGGWTFNDVADSDVHVIVAC